MVEKYFRRRQALARVLSSPAGAYVDDLASHLARQGFGRWKLRQRVHGAAHFSLWSDSAGRSLEQLGEEQLPGFRLHLSSCRCPGWGRRSAADHLSAVAGALSLIQQLRDGGVLKSPAPVTEMPEMPDLVQGFNDWMVLHRGLKHGTLRGYDPVICALIEMLGDAPDEYTALSLREFVLKRVSGASRAHALNTTTAMRNFLRYLIAQGRCRPGLEGAIPTIAIWRQSALPRYLAGTDVNRIIEACDRDTPVGLRDRAALLLLARLALRAGDILALRVGDVDWRQASLRVAGKSRTEIRLPLTQEVGDALSEYLKSGRPPAQTDHLFVRMLAPWTALAVSSVSDLVSRAMSRAGVESPRRGAHVLRHSAATEMLRQGATLDQIGAVLRHRYLDTTAIYAKVDVKRLAEITLPWPGVHP